jgi:Asp-tRNA(Asn)/Glu-tRNA(Gln) amidotransferase C subunit
MMENYRENPDIQKLVNQLKELQTVFDKVTIVNTSDVEIQTDTANRITTIRAKSEIEMSPADFKVLCDKVEELRSGFVS